MDAYIVFVSAMFDDGSGYNDVIWVDAKSGDARHIDGVQDEWEDMCDVSTGKILN
jgi:hypothetical protein